MTTFLRLHLLMSVVSGTATVAGLDSIPTQIWLRRLSVML